MKGQRPLISWGEIWWGSLISAVLVTALIVPLVIFGGMPFWGAVAVELAPQVGWWGVTWFMRDEVGRR